MRYFLRLSAGLAAVGVLLWGASSLQAMPITAPDADVSLDIGGWATAATGWYTPQENAAGEQPPSRMSTSSEQRLNATYGTDTFTAWAQLWRRFDNAGVGDLAQQHIQLIWRPIDNLQIDVGRLAYVHWADRAVQWENYMGWSPAIFGTGNPFFGYIETNDGLDVTYDISGEMRVGVAYMTEGKVNGLQSDADAVTSTIIPHFVYLASPLEVRFSYYLESYEFTENDWADSETGDSTLLVLDVKFSYDDAGSFVKLDVLQRESAAEAQSPLALGGGGTEDGSDTGISLGVTQALGGGSNVFVEANQNTFSDDDLADDVVTLWTRIGYTYPIAEGSKGTIEYYQNTTDAGGDTDAVTDSWLGLAWMQTF